MSYMSYLQHTKEKEAMTNKPIDLCEKKSPPFTAREFIETMIDYFEAMGFDEVNYSQQQINNIPKPGSLISPEGGPLEFIGRKGMMIIEFDLTNKPINHDAIKRVAERMKKNKMSDHIKLGIAGQDSLMVVEPNCMHGRIK